MKIDDKIWDENLQCSINRETAKIAALWSSETDKYEYLKGKGISPSDQRKVIKQTKCTYSPLGKAFK